jgi:hypothetical protein
MKEVKYFVSIKNGVVVMECSVEAIYQLFLDLEELNTEKGFKNTDDAANRITPENVIESILQGNIVQMIRNYDDEPDRLLYLRKQS